jgi:hypothetical protein
MQMADALLRDSTWKVNESHRGSTAMAGATKVKAAWGIGRLLQRKQSPLFVEPLLGLTFEGVALLSSVLLQAKILAETLVLCLLLLSQHMKRYWYACRVTSRVLHQAPTFAEALMQRFWHSFR